MLRLCMSESTLPHSLISEFTRDAYRLSMYALNARVVQAGMSLKVGCTSIGLYLAYTPRVVHCIVFNPFRVLYPITIFSQQSLQCYPITEPFLLRYSCLNTPDVPFLPGVIQSRHRCFRSRHCHQVPRIYTTRYCMASVMYIMYRTRLMYF